jgi:hypothetical protein
MAESYLDITQAQITPARGARREAPTLVEGARASRRRDERIEFYLLYACCFSVFLVAVVIRRLLVVSGLMSVPTGAQLSVVKEAREAVGSTIPYVFMG